MSVPAIASLYASRPIPGAPDYELNPRVPAPASASASASSSSPSLAQKPMAGGLTCLFSSPPSVHRQHSPGGCSDELGTLWNDRLDELSGSFPYSPYSSSLKSRDPSPLSVLHGPVTSWSPPRRKVPRDWNWSEFGAGRDRLFNGFVRNALGSCLEYDPSTILMDDIDDLTFNLEDDLTCNLEENFEAVAEVLPECEPYAKELLSGAQKRHKVFHEELVVEAFLEAEKAHKGQIRASGDPYLQHCVETAVLLAYVGASSTIVAAGLLHDTIDDSFVDYNYIFQIFGTDVADLVEGVSKLSHLSKLARENNTANKTVEADRLHTMFLAMTDARAVLIKLADRLHNMMTLEALPIFKRRRFAKETYEIFTPLANRLGILSWKEQLENLCFKHLYPEKHNELSFKLENSFDEAMVASAKAKLEKALKEEDVSFHVLSGRHKSLYSIYSKMLKKNLTISEIHDIHGLRLIVDGEQDCYKALDVVHGVWPQVAGRFKDYISHPKFNGYQSLHTVVLSGEDLPLEVQIRTKEMHIRAEFGFAAHWRYKEGEFKHSAFVLQMVEWARWVVTWQCETLNIERPASPEDFDSASVPCPFPSHSKDCPYVYSSKCSKNGPIFVIMLENEKMSVQEFPPNSTVMSLLERAGRGSVRWSTFPLKEEDLRPRLNGQPVSNPSQKLKMGDVVELSPAIPDESLTLYREEMRRMYNLGVAVLDIAVTGRSRRRS